MFDIIFRFIVMYVRSLNYIYVALNMFKEKRNEAVVFDIFWYMGVWYILIYGFYWTSYNDTSSSHFVCQAAWWTPNIRMQCFVFECGILF